jgi:hypothetical protein
VGDATFLYRFLFDWAPGFASFRVPARWLLVSTFGLAILGALGVDWLFAWTRAQRLAERRKLARIAWPRLVLVGIVVPLGLASLVVLGQRQSGWHLLVWGLLVMATLALAAGSMLVPRSRGLILGVLVAVSLADLWVAGMNLEHRQTIPDVAFGQFREGIATLIARGGREAAFRNLSIATPEYIVKETEEYEERYGSLGRLALDNLLVTIKWNETLWPNVPLVYGLPSADGYDGGVLPLRNFYAFARAMLGEERARPDGVLASRLDALPDARWLDLLGVKRILASRAKDVTRGAIYYDRAVSATLAPGQRLTLAALPDGEFTRLGLISTVSGAASAAERVGTMRFAQNGGTAAEVPLVVGQNTAPGTWTEEQAPTLERIQGWSTAGPNDPADWLAEITFARQPVTGIEIANDSQAATLVVRSLNLIDDQRQMAFPLNPTDGLERIDLFDVKLFERRDPLPRAYLASGAVVLDDEAAGRRLAEPGYTQRSEVFLAPSPTARPLAPTPPDAPGVAWNLNEPERIVLGLTTNREQYLVVSDSWYPGWRAFVDGVEVPVERANLLFRAIRVESGEHSVELRYESGWFRAGVVISLVSLAIAGFLWGGLSLVWQPGSRRLRI